MGLALRALAVGLMLCASAASAAAEDYGRPVPLRLPKGSWLRSAARRVLFRPASAPERLIAELSASPSQQRAREALTRFLEGTPRGNFSETSLYHLGKILALASRRWAPEGLDLLIAYEQFWAPRLGPAELTGLLRAAGQYSPGSGDKVVVEYNTFHFFGRRLKPQVREELQRGRGHFFGTLRQVSAEARRGELERYARALGKDLAWAERDYATWLAEAAGTMRR